MTYVNEEEEMFTDKLEDEMEEGEGEEVSEEEAPKEEEEV